jgi:hypothetical protein
MKHLSISGLNTLSDNQHRPSTGHPNQDVTLPTPHHSLPLIWQRDVLCVNWEKKVIGAERHGAKGAHIFPDLFKRICSM